MRFKWALVGLVIVLLLGGLGFVIWANDTLPPMPEALAALESDSKVEVQAQPWLIFKPTGGAPTSGFIFYPGGRVDPRAYAPLAHALAARGHLVVIVPMPLNLALFGGDRAADVIRSFPTVRHWVVGGHSLGGVAAASFAKNHPDDIAGLALLGSYPADNEDLSSSRFAVTSIAGSLDGLSTPAKIEQSRSRLPPHTKWVVIEGGNHAQMGWYGAQPGDGTATISRQEQQDRIVEALDEMLGQLGD